MKEHIYFCNQCKKLIDKATDLYFVEDKIPRGFCSETCIEKYFNHMSEHYESYLKELREKLNLVEEDCISLLGNAKYFEKVIRAPNEIFLLENDLKEKLYVFIAEFEESEESTTYMVMYCLVYDFRPSYILMNTVTKSIDLFNCLKIGKKIDDISKFLEKSKENPTEIVQLDDEVITILENKKSNMLARMLTERSSSDIEIEEFHEFENFYKKTLNSPDEIYEYSDEEGDNIFTYIKAHEKEKMAFFYVIICVRCTTMENTKKVEKLFPVMSFPTKDSALYSRYKHGRKISGSLKN